VKILLRRPTCIKGENEIALLFDVHNNVVYVTPLRVLALVSKSAFSRSWRPSMSRSLPPARLSLKWTEWCWH
jgi:hypothetical protein